MVGVAFLAIWIETIGFSQKVSTKTYTAGTASLHCRLGWNSPKKPICHKMKSNLAEDSLVLDYKVSKSVNLI
jgi:hypothetical protein